MSTSKIVVHIGTHGRDGEAYYQLIQQAAKVKNQSMSAFMAEAGEAAAKKILEEEKNNVL